MKTLILLRFRALFAAFTRQSRQKNKQGAGMVVLFVLLYLYLAAVICGAMGAAFNALAAPYHAMGLDWLYFAMAGLMALALSLLGSVFATQSQLYDAKDNDLLLSMPVKPKSILISRMVPLLALNLLYGAVVMVPAMVVYAIQITASVPGILLQIGGLLCITLLTQALACFLGWLLHLLLSKMNKSIASLLYMTIFLGLYFYFYSQAGNILNAIAANGSAIAQAVRTWVYPLYTMGRGCTGQVLPFLAFAAICAIVFFLVYALLSATFLRAATSRRAVRRRKLELDGLRGTSPTGAIVQKERRKFLGCPVYLTNMGLGVILTAALPVMALIFRKQLLPVVEMLGMDTGTIALVISAMLSFMASMCCVSTPSVSLEGKNIWILKSMPVSSRQILAGKLRFHCLATVPVHLLAGAVLSAVLGCGVVEILLCALCAGLMVALVGVLGLLCGLKWARLDYISEAYPCKQSVSVLVIMFGSWGIPMALGLLYGFLLSQFLSATLYLALVCVLLGAVCAALYQAVVTWGSKKWEALI